MPRKLYLHAILLSLISSTAFAQRPSPGVAKARRLTKYFKNAHSAVVNGGMRPHATVTSLGLQGRFMVGLRAGASLGKVVEKGMATPVRAVFAGASFGAQVGLGPEVTRMRYIGDKGMTGREVLPGKETSMHGALIGQMRAARSKQGTKGSGWGVSLLAGGGPGVLGRKVVSRGKASKTPMLQRLEEGLKLSKEVNAAIRAGRTRGIGGKVSRLEHLHSLIAEEKRTFNTSRQEATNEF